MFRLASSLLTTVNLQSQWILGPKQPPSHVPQHSSFKLKMNLKITGTFLCKCTPSGKTQGVGRVDECLGVLATCLGTCNAVVPGCSSPLCYSLDLFSVALTSTCWLCSVKSQFGCLLLVGVLKNCVDVYLLCLYPILFELIISKICKQIKNREIYHTTNYYYYYYYLL